MIKFFIHLACLIFTFHNAWADTSSQASESPDNKEPTPWYEINLIVFAQPATLKQSEQWKDPSQLYFDFPANLITLEQSDQTLPGVAFTQLYSDLDETTAEPAEQLPEDVPARAHIDDEFKLLIERLSRSPSYRILKRLHWRQPALDQDSAIPVLVQGGRQYDELFELEGTVQLHVSRYLHAAADLRLYQYEYFDAPAPLNHDLNAPPSEFELNQSLESEENTNVLLPAEELTPEVGFQPEAPGYYSTRTVQLKESRRMRSNELHYLDHPLLGMVIKVIPYDREQDRLAYQLSTPGITPATTDKHSAQPLQQYHENNRQTP